MSRTAKSPSPDLKPINRWVVDALAYAGISQTKLAEALAEMHAISSKDRSFVNKMALGKRDVSAAEAAAIAKITGFPPFNGGDQFAGTLEPTAIARSGTALPYAGTVQAGAFLAVDDYFNQDPEGVPEFVLADPKYRKVRQYAYRARGDSMNQVNIHDGMWVVAADAADFIDVYGDIETGDLVIVERTRFQGAERELTVKQVHFFKDRYELRPRSTNAEHQVITVPHNHSAEDGIEVKIIGVVLTAYANLRTR